MGKKYFLGVDIGTFESKGLIMDENCGVVAMHSERHEMENPAPNHFEMDAEAVWWGDFCKISHALLEKTGISGMIAKELAENLGALGPYALLAGIYYTTSLVTIFISNTATAVLLAPIAMSAAAGLGVSPYPFLFAVTVSASCCFISPFSTPPNALVMNAGRYVFRDYLKIGGPLQIAMGVVMTFVLPLFFPF